MEVLTLAETGQITKTDLVAYMENFGLGCMEFTL